MTQNDLFSPPPIPSVMDEVKARVNAARDAASEDEREILNVLVTSTEKVTQRELARRCPSIGFTFKDGSLLHEDAMLRRVRHVIRELRVRLRVPVLSDPHGYWLPKTREEVDEYVTRVAKQARATASAWYETLRVVEGFVQSTDQRRLFGAISALAEEFPSDGRKR